MTRSILSLTLPAGFLKALSAGTYEGKSLEVPTFREFCELVKPYDVHELLARVEALVEVLTHRCARLTWDCGRFG